MEVIPIKKKHILMIISALLLLGGAIAAFVFFFIQRDVGEETDESTRLPIISFKLGEDLEVNPLHGYLQEMDITTMRDAVIATGGTHSLTMYIDAPEKTKVKSVEYEIKDLSCSEVLESGDFVPEKMEDGRLTQTFRFGDFWRDQAEVELCLTVTLSKDEKVYYYTRLTRSPALNTYNCAAFAEEFCKKAVDRGNGGYISGYMEPNELSDKNTYANVTMNSSVDQALWGELAPTEPENITCTIKETKEAYTSLVLQYTVTCNGLDPARTMHVEEFYRVRTGDVGMFMLSFERTVEEVFDEVRGTSGSKGIELGITGNKTSFCSDYDSTHLAFAKDGQIWLYNKDLNAITCVYQGAVRSREYFTKSTSSVFPVSVNAKGELIFVVVGYQDNGELEGQNGIRVCSFSEETREVETIIFLSSTQGEEFLEYKESDSIYYNRGDGEVYLIWENALIKISGENGDVSIISNEPEARCVMSVESGYAAYPAPNGAGGLVVLNMVSGESRTITSSMNESLLAIGFINEDFVYGVKADKDAKPDESGEDVIPMYKIIIEDREGTVLKTMENEDVFYLDAYTDSKMVTLMQAKLEAGHYVSNGEDYITNNEAADSRSVEKGHWTDEKRLNVIRLEYSDGLTSQSAAIKKVINVESKYLTVALDDSLPQKEVELYYAYGYGRLLGIFEKAGEAITAADEYRGVVVKNDGTYVWERGNRDLVYEIEDVNVADVPEGKLDLSGVLAEQLCYVINQDKPIRAKVSADTEYLLYGYDNENFSYLNLKTKEAGEISIEEADRLFGAAGRIFYAD